MNLAKATIHFKTFSIMISLLLIVGGVYCYQNLGRLEDPEFTIKDVQIVTAYPGASPKEVEGEVTDLLENSVQRLGQIKEIKSLSQPGLSTITVTVKDKYTSNQLPQIWDELRRKVQDAQPQLPPGAGPSIVYDDFGDVYGVMLALYGKGFSSRELLNAAEFLQREILKVKDVAKVVVWGEQQEQIFIEISRARMKQLGVSLDQVYSSLQKKNVVLPAGHVNIGDEYVRIQPTGTYGSVQDIENTVISIPGKDKQINLSDIAKIERSYISPPSNHMRIDGEEGIVLGISTAQGGNVVTMGKDVVKKIELLKSHIPLGIDIKPIYYQGEIVEKSVNAFVINLLEALAIVIIVLVVFMGLRSGLLIGGVLLLTVAATIVVMYIFGLTLQRISLGALIIALGMLVDNAIVVTEGMLIRLQKGQERLKAACEVVTQTQWPLLGATVIAVLAFAAIGLSPDSSGEFLRSLFQVMLISLGLSWLIAITLTPLYGYMFLESHHNGEQLDPYKGVIFQFYKSVLFACIRLRYITILSVGVLLIVASYCFTLLPQSFFPESTSNQFMLNYWLPEGTDIRKTSRDMKQLESQILTLPHVTSVASFIGGGAPRFMLVYAPEKNYSSYGFMLVTTDDYTTIPGLMSDIENIIANEYIDANPKMETIRLGPGGGFSWEARFSGANPDVLRSLSEHAQTVLIADGGAKGVRDNWRERVKLVVPRFSDEQARRVGLTKQDLLNALSTNYDGKYAGLYREGNKLIPIVARVPEAERVTVNNIYDVQIWSPYSRRTVPLRQVVSNIDIQYEDRSIHREDRARTLTVQAEPVQGNVSELFNRVKNKIESLELPVGYSMEWGGEYEDSAKAQAGLAAKLPVTVLIMWLVTVLLFNAIRQPLIIWMTVPLAIIGVSFGLMLTGESFGFMALLGFLSLSGMLIKNAIVLIDEIDIHIKDGEPRMSAILDASVSRMRPVLMAAFTTVLGMIPLLADVFFKAMAITIMSGLLFATVLTLIVVPVFYAILFKINNDEISV